VRHHTQIFGFGAADFSGTGASLGTVNQTGRESAVTTKPTTRGVSERKLATSWHRPLC
jgi:hypothetical protein